MLDVLISPNDVTPPHSLISSCYSSHFTSGKLEAIQNSFIFILNIAFPPVNFDPVRACQVHNANFSFSSLKAIDSCCKHRDDLISNGRISSGSVEEITAVPELLVPIRSYYG